MGLWSDRRTRLAQAAAWAAGSGQADWRLPLPTLTMAPLSRAVDDSVTGTSSKLASVTERPGSKSAMSIRAPLSSVTGSRALTVWVAWKVTVWRRQLRSAVVCSGLSDKLS